MGLTTFSSDKIYRMTLLLFIYLLLLSTGIHALGQNLTIAFQSFEGSLQLAGGGGSKEILVDGNEWWGVIRAAEDLKADFGRITSRNLSLVVHDSNSKSGSYEYYVPKDHVTYSVGNPSFIEGLSFGQGGGSANTVIIVGTIGKSRLIDKMIGEGKLNVSGVSGKWESYVSKVVDNPIPNVVRALVIAGSDKRGSIYGLYDMSEQIGVSPWYWWADVQPQRHRNIYALDIVKVQGPPSIKYRGFFINDEAPALTNWIEENYGLARYSVAFNHLFYAKVYELLLRLRANYLWPAMWANMFNVDDDMNQPLADAYGIVMGTSHTEPLMRAKDEWPHFGKGIWQWNINNASIKPYFKLGIERARSYESIYTMA